MARSEQRDTGPHEVHILPLFWTSCFTSLLLELFFVPTLTCNHISFSDNANHLLSPKSIVNKANWLMKKSAVQALPDSLNGPRCTHTSEAPHTLSQHPYLNYHSSLPVLLPPPWGLLARLFPAHARHTAHHWDLSLAVSLPRTHFHKHYASSLTSFKMLM